jgi:hypothetical protein
MKVGLSRGASRMRLCNSAADLRLFAYMLAGVRSWNILGKCERR